jgi:hypothetical protein
MKQFFLFFLLLNTTLSALIAQKNQQTLPVWNDNKAAGTVKDWLVYPTSVNATVYQSADQKDIILYNGLVKRAFRITPNVACYDYVNLSSGQQLLRAVEPEALITIDHKPYNIGGLKGQQEKAYLLTNWLDRFKKDANDFNFISYEVSELKPFINAKIDGWAMNKKQPTGKVLTFLFEHADQQLKGIQVKVHYELYDGIPLIVKWVSIENKSNHVVVLNKIINEVLAVVEEESAVVGSPAQMEKQHGLYVETNYAYNNAMKYDLSDQTKHWEIDSTYTSQVNYNYQTPCVLKIYPVNFKGLDLLPNQNFKSVRSYELLMDSYDRERRGLAIRRMYTTVAPWTTRNPIFMHLVSQNDDQVITAIDQCAATGYEALILSFGSHCNMEDSSQANVIKWKKLSDYAHSKNIEIGGYSLFSSRRISDEDDVIDPVTGKPDAGAFFGNAPCMGSKWGLTYINKLKHFISNTGFDIFENDGPYPGDVCASTKHPGHKNLDDSQWEQMKLQKGLYHWLNEQGVYVNAPDWYFLDGTNKIAIGYREVNFSLSRDQQKILNRQNIYDGLWEKTPTMSWGFVPLTRYQGGTEDAVLEPLSEHLDDYRQLMFQYYGAGVQACYRGPRLYDTDQTKSVVIETINWYKKYRDILNSDIIHLRRADGRDWDGIMHVNPQLTTKGFILLYNPLKEHITRTIKIPLYYSGILNSALISENGVNPKKLTLTPQNEVNLTVTLKPDSYTWFTVNDMLK